MEGGLYILFYRCKWSKYLLTFIVLFRVEVAYVR